MFPVLVAGEEFRVRRLVYGLADPAEPHRIRYAGQTTRGPLHRYLGHLSDRGAARGEWIQGLLARDVFPAMVLLEDVTPEADIIAREQEWIARLQERGEADLNAPAWRKGGASC